MMELRGDIPGLLRRGSPCRWLRMTNDMREGVCYFAPLRPTVLLLCHDPCREPATPNPADVTLDLSDPTGRFHARLWLAERGHDVGSEDRAEVLAWSVLSVWRGGRPLKGIAPEWEDKTHGWWGRVAGMLEYALVGKGGDWATFPGRSYFPMHCPFRRDRGNAGGKAAADAALIADGWALTNADGSLTLPPLPGAK